MGGEGGIVADAKIGREGHDDDGKLASLLWMKCVL